MSVYETVHDLYDRLEGEDCLEGQLADWGDEWYYHAHLLVGGAEIQFWQGNYDTSPTLSKYRTWDAGETWELRPTWVSPATQVGS